MSSSKKKALPPAAEPAMAHATRPRTGAGVGAGAGAGSATARPAAAEPDITAMGINAEAAVAVAAEVVQRTEGKFGVESAQLMKPLLQHGKLLLAVDGQRREAVEAVTRCCMLAEIHESAPIQANCLTIMSIAALEQFEFPAAEAAASQALRLVMMMPEESLDDEIDQVSIQAQNVLGEARRELGHPQKGFDMHKSALENARQVGLNHLAADATRGMGKCMVALAAGTQDTDATEVLADAVLLYREAWGDSALTARALCEYGEHLRNCERHDEAEKALREAVQLQSECCKGDSQSVAQTCKILGSLLLARKKNLPEALALIERGVAIFDKLQSQPHNTAGTTAGFKDRSASTLTFKGMILDETGRHDEAALVQRTVVEQYTQLAGADHPYTQAMRQQLSFYEAKGLSQVGMVADQINAGADDDGGDGGFGIPRNSAAPTAARKSKPHGSSAAASASASSKVKKRRQKKKRKTKTKSVDRAPPSAAPSHASPEAPVERAEEGGWVGEADVGLLSTAKVVDDSTLPAVAAAAAASSKPAPQIKSFAAAATPAAPVAPVAAAATAVAPAAAAATPRSAPVRVQEVPEAKEARHRGSQDHRQKHKNKSTQHKSTATAMGSVPAVAAPATEPAGPRPGPAPAPAVAAPASMEAPAAPDDHEEEVVTDEGVSTVTPVPAESIQPADEAEVLEVDDVLSLIQPSSESAVLEVDEVVAIIQPATESQIEDFDDDRNSTDDELLVDAPAPASAPAPAPAPTADSTAAVAKKSAPAVVVTGLRFASESVSATEAPAAPGKAKKLVRMQSHNHNGSDSADEAAEAVTVVTAGGDSDRRPTQPTAAQSAAGQATSSPQDIVGPMAPFPAQAPAVNDGDSTLLIIGAVVGGSVVVYLLWRQLSAAQARR